MSLQNTLDSIRERLFRDAMLREAVLATLEELRRRGVDRSVIAPGAPFPDFLLPDAAGRLVARDDLPGAGRSASVVTFFRGDWCPYCGATLDALEKALPAIEAAGGALVAVTPETGGRALGAQRRRGLRYTVLADVDHGLAAACGIAFCVPDVYRRLLTGLGLDLAERQGNPAWMLPVPATFVLDRAGVVRWSFVDTDFTRRAEPAEIIAAVRAAAA